MVYDECKKGLKHGDKISTWVIGWKEKEPKFIDGIIEEEEEGSWCEGDLRFHASDGHCYIVWFNSAIEAVQHELQSAEITLEHELEMIELDFNRVEAEYKESKQYWTDMLKKVERK